MSTELRAVIGIDVKDFRAGLSASRSSLKELDEAVKTSAANIVLFERGMTGGGTRQQIVQLDLMRNAHRELQATLKATEKQMVALDAYGKIAPTAPPASRPQAMIQVAAQAGQGAAGGAARFGVSRIGAMELGHVGRSLFGSLAAGAPMGNALMMEAPRLLSALGPALLSFAGVAAPLAAATAAAAFAISEHRANRAAQKLRDENDRVGGQAAVTSEALDKVLGDETEQVKKTRTAEKKRHWWQRMFTNSGTTGMDVERARESKVDTRERRDEAVARDDEFKRREFDGDPTVAADRIRETYRQKQADILNSKPKDADEQIAHAKEQYQLSMDELERRQAGQQRAVSLEGEILGIKRAGLDVEEKTAAARLKSAQDTLAAGPKMGFQHDANVNAVIEAQIASDDAQRRRRTHDTDLDTRTRNANLRGSADDVAYQRAVNDRDGVQKKLDDPALKADERKELEAQLAEAKDRVHGLAVASHQKGFEVEKLGIDSEQGRGPKERVAAIEKEIDLLEREKKLNREKNGDDPMVNARLDTQAHSLKKEKEDILFAEQQSLETAQAHTREMALQQGGHGLLASIEATRLSYQQQITAAIREGKTELAATLQVQQTMALNQLRMQAYFMTPGQQNAQRANERAVALGKKMFDRDDGLQQIHRDMNGNPIDGYDPVLKRRRRWGDHRALDNLADTVRGGAANAGKGDGDDKAAFSEATGYLKEIRDAVKNPPDVVNKE